MGGGTAIGGGGPGGGGGAGGPAMGAGTAVLLAIGACWGTGEGVFLGEPPSDMAVYEGGEEEEQEVVVGGWACW